MGDIAGIQAGEDGAGVGGHSRCGGGGVGHRERGDSREHHAAAVMGLVPNDGRGLRVASGMRKSEE